MFLNSGVSYFRKSISYFVSVLLRSILPRVTISKIGVFYVFGKVTLMKVEISSVISSGRSTLSNSLKSLAFVILLATRYSSEFTISYLILGFLKSFIVMLLPKQENCLLEASKSDYILKIVSPLYCLWCLYVASILLSNFVENI